jgi:4-amino-4-deoxy-L-arabinose transferase-like glycosyltransferase
LPAGSIAALWGACLIQLLLLAILLWTAHRQAAWLWPTDNLGEHVLAAGLLFCCLAVLIVLAVGLPGHLTATTVAAGIVLVAALTAWLVPPPALMLAWPMLPAAYRPAAWLLAALALPFAVRAMVLVPLDWDGLTYHVYFPSQWIVHRTVYLPDGAYPYNYLAFYPKNNELLETLVLIVARNDLLAKALNLPLIGLTAVATGLVCRRLGGSPTAAWGAAGLIVTTPAMFSWAATTYAEPLLNFAVLTALYFAMTAWSAEGPQMWRAGLLAGLGAGLAAGTKFTALYFVVLLVLALALLPWLRRTGWSAGLRFLTAFGGAVVLVGAWWYAFNAFATGNPVYPVKLAGLPYLKDPDRPGMDSMTILTTFGDLFRYWHLPRMWLGNPPEWSERWRVGPELILPPQLGFGLKLLLLLPLGILGLAFCLSASGGRQPPEGSHSDLAVAARPRQSRLAAAMPRLLAGLAIVVLAYTYLKLPYWGDLANLYYNVRFAIPFVAIAVAAGCARFTPAGERCLPWLVTVGMGLDALVLDLRFPYYSRLASFGLLLGLMALVYLACRIRWPWRGLAVGATVAGVLGLGPLLWLREHDRYTQWATLMEVHSSSHGRFAGAAAFLQAQYPGRKLAYDADFASLLYLFVGPHLDRELVYPPPYPGPAQSYKHGGQPRVQFDRAVWLENLRQSGAQLLLTFRFDDRQLKASKEWPIEYRWAKELGWRVEYQDQSSCLFLVPAGDW